MTGTNTIFEDESGVLVIGPSDDAEVIIVSSLSELRNYLGSDNVSVKLEPGTYTVTADDVKNGEYPDRHTAGPYDSNVLFLFTGSNSTYDFTGVTIVVEVEVFNAYGNDSLQQFQVIGNGNVFKNLTMVDHGSEDYRINWTVVNVVMDGIGNRIEGFHITGKASFPYGYGDAFGKGAGPVISHDKHSAVLIRGESNHFKDSTIIHNAYGHCLFMQAANNPLIEGCYIQGEMRSTEDMLLEAGTGSAADNVDFMTVWGYKLPTGYMMSLQEAGIRAYNTGRTVIDGEQIQRGTSNPTVRNCTVKRVRAAVTLSHATGSRTIEGCTVIECEQGYAIGGGTISNSSGDSKYGPVLSFPYSTSSGCIADITLLPNEGAYNGSRSVAYVGGLNHAITLRDSSQNVNQDLVIKVSGDRNYVRNLTEGQLTASNLTINNYTNYPLELAPVATGITGESVGALNDMGTSNSVSQIDDDSCGGFATFYRVEAEDFCEQFGVEILLGNDGTASIGNIDDGDWIKFNRFFFSAGPDLINLEVASESGGGAIELRIGAVDGLLAGTIMVETSGGLSNWESVASSVDQLVGVEDLYLVFRSSGNDLFRLDAFQFDMDVPVDSDDDGLPNRLDTDDDGDGTEDSEDAFPLDASESVDSDSDGIGDNADRDDDGNGVDDLDEHTQLINISTRAYVLDGDMVGIAGFVVEGDSPVTVLIQGVGPELALDPFLVEEFVANPRISLHGSSGELLLENDDWESNDVQSILDAASATGSFDLSAGSGSSAILTNLEEGAYTVILRSVDQVGGIALIEVYEVPK